MAETNADRAFRITFDGRGLGVRLLSSTEILKKEIREVLSREAKATAARVQERRLTGPSAGRGRQTSRDQLGSRSGMLRRSIGFRVTPSTGLSASAEVGTFKRKEALRYAYAHEYGATIRPRKPGGFLTIPLPASLTPLGVARWTAAELRDGRGFDTWVDENDEGKLLIYGVRTGAKRARVLALFLLVRQVKIPPRPFLRPEAEQWFNDVQRGVGAALASAWKRSGKEGPGNG